jgi:hypothetical protein
MGEPIKTALPEITTFILYSTVQYSFETPWTLFLAFDLLLLKIGGDRGRFIYILREIERW